MGSVRQIAVGKTRLVWDGVFMELKCEKCQAILYFNFDFKRCPYCKRKIVEVEGRRIV